MSRRRERAKGESGGNGCPTQVLITRNSHAPPPILANVAESIIPCARKTTWYRCAADKRDELAALRVGPIPSEVECAFLTLQWIRWRVLPECLNFFEYDAIAAIAMTSRTPQLGGLDAHPKARLGQSRPMSPRRVVQEATAAT